MKMLVKTIRITAAMVAACLTTTAVHAQQSAVRPPTQEQLQAAITNPQLPPSIASNPAFQPVSNWGCEVLMCLSNPNGPTAVRECEPPINRLWRELAEGRPFPHCQLNNGQNSRTAGTWVQPNSNYYNMCPSGTTPLAPGGYALFTRTPAAAAASPGPAMSAVPGIYQGIGDGNGVYPDYRSGTPMPPLVCVGRLLSTTPHNIYEGGFYHSIQVWTFDTVIVQQATKSSSVFDIYIDNKLYTRTRY